MIKDDNYFIDEKGKLSFKFKNRQNPEIDHTKESSKFDVDRIESVKKKRRIVKVSLSSRKQSAQMMRKKNLK